MEFACGFRREIDNYLDMSHFAFAHASTLGVAAQRVIEEVILDHHRDGIEMNAPFPALATPGTIPGKLQSPHHRRQRVFPPNFTTIRQSFQDGDERVLLHVPSPNTRTTCTVFWALTVSPGFDGPAIDDQVRFAVRVLDEDRIMVENQVPAEIPVAAEEGVTFPADRFPMAYKRAWREFIEHGGIRKQAPSTEVNRTERLAVCWGSQSGNAERLAASLVHDLEDRGLSAQLFDMDLVTPSDLRAFDAVNSKTNGRSIPEILAGTGMGV
jgi:phenylpropionate dioxygenase-like ring-hydroxylating dioxygenase large terminal subunit